MGYSAKSVGYVASLCLAVSESLGFVTVTQTFPPITSITDDVTWYKYIYMYIRTDHISLFFTLNSVSLASLTRQLYLNVHFFSTIRKRKSANIIARPNMLCELV